MATAGLRGFDSAGAWVVPERPSLRPYEAAFLLQVREDEVLATVGEEALIDGSGDEVSIYAVTDAFDRRSRDGLIAPLGRMVFEAVAWGRMQVHPGPPDELPPASFRAATASRRLTYKTPRRLDELRPSM